MTDSERGVLLWVLWHHQGGSSPVGQQLRTLLGIEPHAHLTDEQVAEAQSIDGRLSRAVRGEASPSVPGADDHAHGCASNCQTHATCTCGATAAVPAFSDEAIKTIARKHAAAYTNRHAPGESSFGFMDKALIAFARELVAAAGVAVVPAGYALVPMEPKPSMSAAGGSARKR